jgi:4-amino-4-deoxy-L-arabinose transferase-like glycosyltransferase
MRRHLRNPWVWVVAAILLAAWLFWPRAVQSPAPGEAPGSGHGASGAALVETRDVRTTDLPASCRQKRATPSR